MDQRARRTVCNLATNDSININIAKFWLIESCERLITRSPKERTCETHFMQTYKRTDEGRFIVSLPIKADILQNLRESREIALQRLHSIERKLNREPRKSEYKAFLQEYVKLGHMREFQEPVNDDEAHAYLPHHYVIKESSTTTKLRVVFDASSKTTSGISLNKALMVGPIIQQESTSILIRFRIHEYALTGDIEKMYRQIVVNQTQTSLQRILWRENSSDDVKTYELFTLTYGTASASFIATKVIQQLAELEVHQFPKGALAARRDFYIDDLISGADSMQEVLQIRNQLIDLLAKGCFKISKWACSSSEILKVISDSKDQVLELDKDGSTKTLGINWNTRKDAFQYKITIKVYNSQTCTKRAILSQISQVFDPLGLLEPVIITAKVLMQRLWRMQIDWNEALPQDIHAKWLSYTKDLKKLEKLVIPRKVTGTAQDVRRELHGFSDASERAYGACVYMRSIGLDRTMQVHLICAKSRVAPLKTISMPRLELCGAQLLAQLMEKVVNAIQSTIDGRYYRTDSLIVLHWIQANNKKLPVFVAHRIGEIQKITHVENWKHVSNKENPADLISRGISAQELVDSQLWWGDPQWLRCNELQENRHEVTEYDEEQLDKRDRMRIVVTASHEKASPFDIISTFIKLVRVAATCLRFVRNCKKQKQHGPLTVNELQDATKCLIRGHQTIAFAKEIQELTKQGTVSNQSELKQLNPFIDEEDSIRVGGRLQHANLQTSRQQTSMTIATLKTHGAYHTA